MPGTPGARSALDPRVAAAIKTCLNANSGAAQVTSTDLEVHDPRFVGRISDQIRRILDDALYQAIGWRALQNPMASAQFVIETTGRSPLLAHIMSTSGSGYIREAAAHRMSAIVGPFSLALLVNRLNDWVPNVRQAAEARLRDALPALDRTLVAGCIEYLGRFDEYGRASTAGRELVAVLTGDEATTTCLRDWFAGSSDDRVVRLFQLLMRSSSIDDLLPEVAMRHRHPRVRAAAAKVALEGVFVWRARTLQKRSVTSPLDRMTLAHALLKDRSADVQHHALQYLSQNMEDGAALDDILMRYLLHPRQKLSEVAQWRLNKRDVDWLEHVRRQHQKVPLDIPIARLLGRVGTQSDGEHLWRSAQKAPTSTRPIFVLAATRLSQKDAIAEARELALRGANLSSASAASAALLDAGEVIDVEDLIAAANDAELFPRRGLVSHVHKHVVMKQLKVFCRLEANGLPPDGQELGRLARRLNQGFFDPTAAELDGLRQQASDAPRVANFMRRYRII